MHWKHMLFYHLSLSDIHFTTKSDIVYLPEVLFYIIHNILELL